MRNVAVFMGYGNEEDAGNKNRTFKRIYAKPQRLALNLGLNSIEYQQTIQQKFASCMGQQWSVENPLEKSVDIQLN